MKMNNDYENLIDLIINELKTKKLDSKIFLNKIFEKYGTSSDIDISKINISNMITSTIVIKEFCENTLNIKFHKITKWHIQMILLFIKMGIGISDNK